MKRTYLYGTLPDRGTPSKIGVPYIRQGTTPENSTKGVWSFFLSMLVVKPSNVCREKVHGENFSLNMNQWEIFMRLP